VISVLWIVLPAVLTIVPLQVRFLYWFRGDRLVREAAKVGPFTETDIHTVESLLPVRYGSPVRRRAGLIDFSNTLRPVFYSTGPAESLPSWEGGSWRVDRTVGIVVLAVRSNELTPRTWRLDIPPSLVDSTSGADGKEVCEQQVRNETPGIVRLHPDS